MRVPDLETTPIEPFLKMNPGMIPILASPGVKIPGQFGRIKVQLNPLMYSRTSTMSLVGMPSVIHTIILNPASADSMMASAANAGGTKMMLRLADASRTAS